MTSTSYMKPKYISPEIVIFELYDIQLILVLLGGAPELALHVPPEDPLCAGVVRSP